MNTTDNKIETPVPVGTGDLFGGLRPLAKGDTVQRGDIFIDDGRRFEMDTRGFLLGVRCLGQTIRKDNGGWHRSSPNTTMSQPGGQS